MILPIARAAGSLLFIGVSSSHRRRLGSGVLDRAITSKELGPAASWRPVFATWQRWALLVAFVLLLVLRLPGAWAHGRFQDEEATVFLAYAWHYPPLEALFRPFGGYLNLGATATTVLAAESAKSGILPLERAPYLTMGIALLFQALPAVLILTGRAQWLESRLAVIAALLFIAIAPATEEVFFNVLHIQFHLALCVALILALDVPERALTRIGYGVLLFLAPLCGPGSIVFLPLYALRALIDRDRGRLIQMVPLAAGAAIQLLIFYGASPVRAPISSPQAFSAALFVRLIALPGLGVAFAEHIAPNIYASEVVGSAYWILFAGAAILALGALLAVAARRLDAALWLVISGLLIASVSFSVGMVIVSPASLFDVHAGERYNFLPLVLIGWGLIALAMRPGFRSRKTCAGFVGLMLFTGAMNYPAPLSDFAEGPSWPAEVAIWRSDHRHPLQVWPRPFAADLSDEKHVCTPPGRDLSRSNDPRYCESGWVAAFFPQR